MTDAKAYSAGAPISGSALACEQVDGLTRAFSGDRGNRVARNAVTSSDVVKAARNPVTMRSYRDTFGVSLDAAKTVTNQRQSGRCWLFSTLNVLRAKAMRALDVDDFELSQAYGMFYDKLEKANSFLENVVTTADRPWDDRAVAFILKEGFADGGEWSYGSNLVAKWGAVPKDVMPETACSKNSAQMNDVLRRLLHKDAHRLRRLVAAGASPDEVSALRAELMAEVHRVLCSCLGEPPVHFDLEMEVGAKAEVDEGKVSEVLPLPGDAAEDGSPDDGVSGANAKKPRRLLRDRAITPREFVERYVRFDPADYVELVSIPGCGREFGHAYGLRWMDTVVGGRRLRFLNMPMEVLEDAAVASLKAGVPMYMACDVGQEFGRRLEDFPGVLACDTMDRDSLFDVDLSMTREEMYDSFESRLTHAMTFQGVELGEDGRPAAWRVENSWGKESCKDGYLVMSGEWYRTYGGDVVVERRFVPDEVLKLWDHAELEMQDPWSGMGCALSGIGR